MPCNAIATVRAQLTARASDLLADPKAIAALHAALKQLEGLGILEQPYAGQYALSLRARNGLSIQLHHSGQLSVSHISRSTAQQYEAKIKPLVQKFVNIASARKLAATMAAAYPVEEDRTTGVYRTLTVRV